MEQRRRAQNRASQRAYRERKDQRIKDLEQLLANSKEKNDELASAYELLHAEFLKLRGAQARSRQQQQQHAAAAVNIGIPYNTSLGTGGPGPSGMGMVQNAWHVYQQDMAVPIYTL
jgi:hypothetical protein